MCIRDRVSNVYLSISLNARLADMFFSSDKVYTYCIKYSVMSFGTSIVTESLFCVYAGHRLTYMFIKFSNRKETTGGLFGCLLYRLLYVIGFTLLTLWNYLSKFDV